MAASPKPMTSIAQGAVSANRAQNRIHIRRQKPVRRVLVHGLAYFGRLFADFMDGEGWEFRYYPDRNIGNLAAMAKALYSCDLAYQIGGRVTIGKFLRVAKTLGKTKIVMHWIGSDTLSERHVVADGNASKWVLDNVHHWADSNWLLEEVEMLGVRAELVGLPSPLVPERPTPLPKDFAVLVYMPDMDCSRLYGLDRILEVAASLPQIRFELVGLRNGQIPSPPSNMRVQGKLPNLSEVFKHTSVLWRPARHDGLSFMVLEALGHGRHVLWSYPFPGCTWVKTPGEAREEILRLHALYQNGMLEMNSSGPRGLREHGYMPAQLKNSIRERLEEILES
jgi:hypothetical protein